MKNALFVSAGAALGIISRWGLASLLIEHLSAGYIWASTITVNLMGAFLLGYLGSWLQSKVWTLPVREFTVTGFLASFTTYSAFSADIAHLFNQSFTAAFIYILISIFAGYGLYVIGRKWGGGP